MTINLITKLKQFFISEQVLPGEKSQQKMVPSIRKVYERDQKIKPIKACVLLLLIAKERQIELVFIKRANNNDKHSGQMAFAGGKQDVTDSSDIDTALREANEEIGIRREDVEIIGKLTELYIPVSNFIVQPIVGYLPYCPEFNLSEDEVEKVVSIEINKLLATEAKIRRMMYKKVGFDAPYYEIKNEYVWGATAMILSEFIDVVKEFDILHER